MQDGFIFSDTIANNIAVASDNIDNKRLKDAAETANIREFIDSLPLGYNTKIGMNGNGISQGQRQWILIARTVYKNPHYIFFDEATNALDANNERKIMNLRTTPICFVRTNLLMALLYIFLQGEDGSSIVHWLLHV